MAGFARNRRPDSAEYARANISAEKLELLHRRASQDDAEAQYQLGKQYHDVKDYGKARQWYGQAAVQGHAAAQRELGSFYSLGLGGPEDKKKGWEWYEKAAEQGDIAAQLFLGYVYMSGLDAPQDNVRAHMWLSLVIAQLRSGKFQDNVASTRDSIADRMSLAELAEAKKMVREWKPTKNK